MLAETDQGLAARTPQRLDAIASDVAATYQQLAGAAGVRLHDRPGAGDGGRARRRCWNGWSRTWCTTPSSTTSPAVRSCLRVRPGQPVLSVTNTGPPVPAETVPGLFEPFRRARGDRLDHSGGAGLGLTIARSITQAHDGHIAAAAQPAGGLAVTVELPGPS